MSAFIHHLKNRHNSLIVTMIIVIYCNDIINIHKHSQHCQMIDYRKSHSFKSFFTDPKNLPGILCINVANNNSTAVVLMKDGNNNNSNNTCVIIIQ